MKMKPCRRDIPFTDSGAKSDSVFCIRDVRHYFYLPTEVDESGMSSDIIQIRPHCMVIGRCASVTYL